MLSTDIPKITIRLIGYEDGILLDKQVHASINICTGEVADAVSPCRLPFGRWRARLPYRKPSSVSKASPKQDNGIRADPIDSKVQLSE